MKKTINEGFNEQHPYLKALKWLMRKVKSNEKEGYIKQHIARLLNSRDEFEDLELSQEAYDKLREVYYDYDPEAALEGLKIAYQYAKSQAEDGEENISGSGNTYSEGYNSANAITEARIKKIVAESVKKVLKESHLYGDPQPFHKIFHAARELMKRYEPTQENGYENSDDFSYDMGSEIYQWAKEISEKADEYSEMFDNTYDSEY